MFHFTQNAEKEREIGDCLDDGKIVMLVRTVDTPLMLRHFPIWILGQEVRRIFDDECTVQDKVGDILFTIGVIAHFLDSACSNEDAETLGNTFGLCHGNTKTRFLSDVSCNCDGISWYSYSRPLVEGKLIC